MVVSRLEVSVVTAMAVVVVDLEVHPRAVTAHPGSGVASLAKVEAKDNLEAVATVEGRRTLTDHRRKEAVDSAEAALEVDPEVTAVEDHPTPMDPQEVDREASAEAVLEAVARVDSEAEAQADVPRTPTVPQLVASAEAETVDKEEDPPIPTDPQEVEAADSAAEALEVEAADSEAEAPEAAKVEDLRILTGLHRKEAVDSAVKAVPVADLVDLLVVDSGAPAVEDPRTLMDLHRRVARVASEAETVVEMVEDHLTVMDLRPTVEDLLVVSAATVTAVDLRADLPAATAHPGVETAVKMAAEDPVETETETVETEDPPVATVLQTAEVAKMADHPVEDHPVLTVHLVAAMAMEAEGPFKTARAAREAKEADHPVLTDHLLVETVDSEVETAARTRVSKVVAALVVVATAEADPPTSTDPLEPADLAALEVTLVEDHPVEASVDPAEAEDSAAEVRVSRTATDPHLLEHPVADTLLVDLVDKADKAEDSADKVDKVDKVEAEDKMDTRLEDPEVAAEDLRKETT